MADEPNRKPKPTKAQIEQRVAEIVSIRLAGAQIWDVREYVREKEGEVGSPWQLPEGQKPLSDPQLYRYIAKADKAIASSCLSSRKKLLRRHRARREYLYGLAVNQGDVRAALSVLDSEAKLCGLFEDELSRQIDELQRQIAEMRANGVSSPTAASEAPSGGTGDAQGADQSDPGTAAS